MLALGIVASGAVATTATAAAPEPTATGTRADAAGPWSVPTALTGTTDSVDVIDVRTAPDGTVVAAMYREVPATSQLELRVAVRPAASGTWGAPTVIDTLNAGRETVQLLPAPDGSVTLTWVRASSENTIRTSTLVAGATAWSNPVDIAQGTRLFDVTTAIGASGKAVAVWNQSSGRSTQVYASERDGANGAWSSAVRLDDTPAETLEGVPQVLVAPDGSLTAVWSEYGPERNTVKAVDKPVGATGWTAPRTLSAPTSSASGVRAGVGPDGEAVLVWTASGDLEGAEQFEVVVRPAGSTEWGPIETVGPVDNALDPRPLVAPNGEITVVWVDWRDTFGVRTVTRSTTGDWSAVRTLSTEYVPEQFDAEIGPDGTVQAGWVQNAATGEDGRVFLHAARVDGVWTAPTQLSRKPSGVAIGQVAGGPEGRATAVWHESVGSFTGQLWTAGTGLTDPNPDPDPDPEPDPEPPAKPSERRDYVGADGFVDLFAQTSAGALTIYQGKASGVYSAKVQGGTWPTTSTLIPFGDVDGNNVNDVLVRDAAGGLRAYHPAYGKPVTPNSPSTPVGTGWTGFDAFAVSGDFTGDQRPDLIARQTSTGDLYLYRHNGKAALTKVGLLAAGWKTKTPIGAGDLNGDGHADLLARDAAGILWRHFGTGKSTLGPAVKVGPGWGPFTAIVGAGDLTKDGKDDLVARDAGGLLWRYTGNGAGGFAKPVKIGTGWNGFATLN
ncbi:FG-GAP repeat domain-containing protein [Streptomyces sp. NBC_01716]|uniref:FG-GAP repeat domain-containing protein n=1 Tax=Streptomyces sp. NBC_01716 TaxID=2975917 RepID=UPI002E348980|nr:VCBS repeat-containing protein [Streptomyces sp. NBC_01716]